MAQLLHFSLPLPKTERLWAVMAWQGRRSRVANVHVTQEAAQADCAWRSRQIREYGRFLASEQKAPLRYEVRQIGRSDLPKGWVPLPALGFLRRSDF